MRAGTIDLKRLRAFHLAALHGNLQRAAAQLALTVPAVSIQISKLEQELGVQLFQRIGKRLLITSAGERFFSEVETVLNAFDHAIESVSGSAPLKGRVSLAIGHDVTLYFARAIASFVKTYPGVDLALRIRGSQEIAKLVTDGEVDLGVGYFGPLSPELSQRVLGTTGFSLICPKKHPLASIRNPDLAEIGRHRLISLPAETRTGRRIERAFAEAGVAPVGLMEAGNCRTSREFAQKGVGAAIVHTACLGKRWPAALVRIDVTRYLGTVNIAAIHRTTRRLSQAHLDFLAALSP